MTDNIDKNEIRKAIDRLQLEHPCHFAFDATKFDSTDSIDVVKRVIDNVMESIRDDADIHIICEFAKLYLDGVKPTIEPKRPRGEWIPYKWDGSYTNKIPLPKGSDSEWEEYWGEEFLCSVCGKAHHIRRFCPYCGADMRKEGEPD